MILLVEDNMKIAKGLIYALKQNNYEVIYASTLKEGKSKLENEKVDLVILDISLPDGNGFTFFEENINSIKTIFLTAKDTEDDIVHGLEIGASDYITKPFSTRELLARIKRLLNDSCKNLFKIKDIEYDVNKMVVYKNKEEVNLSSLELKILNLLFTNINKVVTRDSIIEHIWEWTGNDVYDNTITVYMKRIREKLGTDIIKTLKGIGYRIDNE